MEGRDVMSDLALRYTSALYEENDYPENKEDMFEDTRTAYEEGWQAAYDYYVKRRREPEVSQDELDKLREQVEIINNINK